MRAWVVLLMACAGPAGGVGSGLPPSVIDGLRGDAKAVWKVQQDAAYRVWTEAQPVNPADAVKGHERLYSKEAVTRLGVTIGDVRDENAQRALRYLRRHVSWELLGAEIGVALDAFEQQKGKETITVDGQVYPFAQLLALESAERDQARRKRLQDAALPAYQRLHDSAMKLETETQQAAKRVGFPSYLELASDVRATDLSLTSRAADTFLTETDAAYLVLIKKVVPTELGFGFDRVRMSDVARLLAGARYDAYLPEDLLVTTQAQVTRDLRLDLAQTPMKIHADKLPTKTRRPRVFPVAPPYDVRLSLYPRPGLTGFENMLHATGRALLYAREKTPVFEFQVLGDETVATAYGMLFAGLAANPEWVKTALTRIPEAERANYLRFMQARRMLLARRYAAKVMFEVGWHSGQTNDPARLYQNVMSRAHGFRFDENDARRWLVDHEPLFHSAEVLRGWMLAAQIEAKLVEQFGPRWFERQDAGNYLDQLWSSGLELTADEVSKKLGFAQLDGKALVAALK